MLGSQPDGEDATQHAFVALHRHITADERDVDVKPWLFQVARNRCLSIIRARREHADIDDPVVQPATEGLADSVQRRTDLRELLGDLQQLPEDQRAALLLSSLGDLSGDEIADVVGCRPQKVKALVFQARTSLMNERDARNTDCEVVREQLATLRGGALLRGSLRRHVRSCEGCRAFRDADPDAARGDGAPAAGHPDRRAQGRHDERRARRFRGCGRRGGDRDRGGGVIAGLAAGGKAGAAKVLVAAALAGGSVGAGVAEVKHLRNDKQPAAPVEHAIPGIQGNAQTSKALSTSGAAGEGRERHGQRPRSVGAHGKPTSSPAKSEPRGDRQGHLGHAAQAHSGVTGKAGAPGQHEDQDEQRQGAREGQAEHSKTLTPRADTRRLHPAKPRAPAPAQAKQQPVATHSTVTSVTGRGHRRGQRPDKK